MDVRELINNIAEAVGIPEDTLEQTIGMVEDPEEQFDSVMNLAMINWLCHKGLVTQEDRDIEKVKELMKAYKEEFEACITEKIFTFLTAKQVQALLDNHPQPLWKGIVKAYVALTVDERSESIAAIHEDLEKPSEGKFSIEASVLTATLIALSSSTQTSMDILITYLTAAMPELVRTATENYDAQ